MTKDQFQNGLAVIVGVLAIAGVGYTVGHDNNGGFTDYLRARNEELQKDNDELKARLTSASILNVTGKSSTPIPKTQLDTSANQSKIISSQTGSVYEQQTLQLFDGKLLISMYGTKYEGDPSHNTFYGSVSSPGQKPAPINKVSPGDTVPYGGYAITFLSVGVLSADISVIQSEK